MLKKLYGAPHNKFYTYGFLLLIFAYSPGVFKESFWSDDYPALTDPSGLGQLILKNARPTYAWLLSSSFSILGDPGNAWVLRSLSLIALLLIFVLVSKSISDSRYRNIGTLTIAVAFCLPSFQMYVHWSIAWPYLWAALAGLFSLHLWSSKQALKRVISVLLLALALTTYPPAALFFFASIVFTNVLNESKSQKFIAETIQGLRLLAISVSISLLVVFLTMKLTGSSPSERVKLVTLAEVPDKIIWLFTRPFVIGLRPFAIDSPSPIFGIITSLPVLLLLVLGIARQSRQLQEGFLYRSTAVVFPLLLTLIPIIVTSDNQIEFRILPGYSWGVAAIASFFLFMEVKTWPKIFGSVKRLENVSLFLIGTILSLVAIVSVNVHYSELFGGPYQKKNTFLNSKISSCLNYGRPQKIIILPPKEAFPSLPRLGVFSMSTDLASSWVPQPNVELLLKKRSLKIPVEYLEIRPAKTESTTTVCVIDLEEFRKFLN